MLVLGLQGSPRKKGNTNYLLSAFMEAVGKRGVQTHIVDVTQKNIEPCKEYVVCEKKGFCPINDDVKDEIYPLMRRAEVVVIATPIFFYNMTAQLKAVIDRCQTFWARKYKLKLKDPGASMRRGFLLAVGASTKGKNLFDGLHLTARVLFRRDLGQVTKGAWHTEELKAPKTWPSILRYSKMSNRRWRDLAKAVSRKEKSAVCLPGKRLSQPDGQCICSVFNR